MSIRNLIILHSMQKVIYDLNNLLRSDNLMNPNLAIGRKLQELNSLISRGYMTDQFDLEPTVVYLINANNRQLSFVNSIYTGLIAVACYKNRTHIEYWKILPLLEDEIQSGSLQAIIIFGVFAKHLGEKIIMVLRDFIRKLLRINETRILPFVVQCFRRIIKGTDSYVFDEAIEVIDYISRGLNSPNIEIKIQCIKTLPVIMESTKLGMKKLFTPVESQFESKNSKLRFAIAKSLAKMIYYTGQQKDQTGFGQSVYDPKKTYKVCFSTILEYAKNEKNIPLLCHTMMIWIRFLQPDDISKKISLFTKFALSIVSLNLPIAYACTFSRTVFRAVTSVIGSTYDPLLCHYVFDDSKKEGFGMMNTAICLDTLINFRASAKTIKKAAKSFYQLLASKDREIVRLLCSFFVIVGRRDQKTSQILVDSFISWLNSTDIKPLEINGYSRGIAILVMTSNIAQSSILKIHDIIKNWLPESIERTDPRFSAALLLCTAVFKRSPIDFPMQIILLAFKQLPRLFRNGEKITEENINLNTPMKFGAMLMKQVIMSNIDTLLSLQPTIQQVSVVVTHNAAYLSSPTLLSMWLAIRTCKAAWHISLPQSMFIATPTILQRFYNPHENKYDWGCRQCKDDVDLCEELYKTNLPSQYYTVSSDKMETIYTLILSDVRTPMREELIKIVLRDYSPWSVFCAHTLLKSTCLNLFSQEKEKDKLLQQVRFMCINAVSKKNFIGEFIPKESLKNLLSYTSTDARTIRLQGAAIASLVLIKQEYYDDLMDYIEEPSSNPPLIAAIISELKFPKEREVDGIRCLLALERLMITDPHPIMFFAMMHLIEMNVITSDFVGQTFEILEDVSFNDAVRNTETLYYLGQCIQNISGNDERLRQHVSDTYLHQVFNKNLSLLLGLEMKSPNDRQISINYDFTIDKPRPILNAYFKYLESAKDIPIILGIIQQGFCDGESKMRELFFRFKNVNFWVFVTKLVIIKGTVPFVGTNMRVSPSVEVIQAMMTIADLITQQIFINYPANRDKIEDLLSFPTAVLALKDHSVHSSAYKMLNTFVSLFCEVKDNNNNLELNNYANTIQDAFRTVFDESHKLSMGLTFAMSYYKFLKQNECEFTNTAYRFIIDASIVAIQNDPITFIRIAGRAMDILNEPIPEIQNQFAEKVGNFITNVCKQTRTVSELGNEVYTTIATYIKMKKEVNLEWTFTLSLLWEMMSYGFNESMLKLLISLLIRNKRTEKEMINYVLFVIGRSSLFNNPHMDISTMRVIGEFLGVVSSVIPRFAEGWEDTWEYTLSLSLSSFNSYRALALLLRCGSTQLIMQIAGPFVASIIHDDIKYCGALLTLLFYRIPSSVIDQIIPYVIRGEYAPYEKFNVLLHMLRATGKTALINFEDISRLTSFFFFDEGALFVGNLLSDDRTDVYGINLLRLGIADSIFRANISLEQLSLVTNVIYLATVKIKQLFPIDYWQKAVANFTLNMIITHPDAEQQQIAQLVQVLNLIDKDILTEAYRSITDPELLMQILMIPPPSPNF